MRICWVSYQQMAELDVAYQTWLTEKAKDAVDSAALTKAQNSLVKELEELSTVYPAVQLHDCAEGEDENMVMLGQSNLGIY